MSDKKRGIIYYRVSTEDQAQFGISLEQQKNHCLNYAENNNIEVVKMFHDDGVSAKTADRPDLQKMLKYCSQRSDNINVVIVYKIDRLSRNVNDYTNILILLNKLKIKLASTTEAIDDTPIGKFIGNIMAASAQFDNELKGERVLSCMMEKIKQGYWCWKAPFGYLNSTDEFNHKVVVLDKARAPLVKFIFETFTRGIYTLEEIKKMVNKDGLRTWRGKEISSQLINKIVNNAFYIGIMQVCGKEYLGNHEKIISEEIFYRCQKLLRGYSREENISRSKKNEDFPLRHFIICGYCGRPMTAYYATGKLGGRYPYYSCYNRSCPSRKSIAKKKLEEDFLKLLQDVIPTDKFLSGFKVVILDVWTEKYKTINQTRLKVAGEIEKLKDEKLKLIEMKKKELLDDNDFKEAFDKIKADITEKEIYLSNHNLEEFDLDKAVTFVFNFIKTLPEYWAQCNCEQKIKLQGLIFPQKPIYDLFKFQTPELCPILATKRTCLESKSPLVALTGIEPVLPH